MTAHRTLARIDAALLVIAGWVPRDPISASLLGAHAAVIAMMLGLSFVAQERAAILAAIAGLNLLAAANLIRIDRKHRDTQRRELDRRAKGKSWGQVIDLLAAAHFTPLGRKAPMAEDCEREAAEVRASMDFLQAVDWSTRDSVHHEGRLWTRHEFTDHKGRKVVGYRSEPPRDAADIQADYFTHGPGACRSPETVAAFKEWLRSRR